MAKSCKDAHEVLDMVEQEERRISSEEQQQANRRKSAVHLQSELPSSGKAASRNQKSPMKQVASNSSVHTRYMWIKFALIENKLVPIVEHLAQNSAKYYEQDALMSNYLCAQILSSLLVGPSALEFSRSKTNDYYYEDPSADELLKRHKLANPIACLCNQQHQQELANYSPLSWPMTGQSQLSAGTETRLKYMDRNSLPKETGASIDGGSPTMTEGAESRQQPAASPANEPKENRRRPLAIKTSSKTRGTLVTDCHHYYCQEISEHQQTRGYSFLCSFATNGPPTTPNSQANSSSSGGASSNSNQEWPLWSPRMLHETLHQNSKSILLYAKNNVLIETQTNETIAGYLSLHQTCSDLLLKWIPNQMINGTQATSKIESSADEQHDGTQPTRLSPLDQSFTRETGNDGSCDKQTVIESSYLDLVVNLSVSRVVLLHCQFVNQRERDSCKNHKSNTSNYFDGNANVINDREEPRSAQHESQNSADLPERVPSSEETLILVEADGTQRAPFKFPKGGLRLFLSCLESGLQPDRYLDPAIDFDDSSTGALQAPAKIALKSAPNPVDQPKSDSPTSPSDFSPSRLGSFLRRLPSLKQSQLKQADSNEDNSTGQIQTESPTKKGNANQVDLSNGLARNFVYRIVSTSHHQEWQAQTPPNSALCLHSAPLTTATNEPSGQNASEAKKTSQLSSQRFRWSLSRLTKFSARYRQSGSTTSTSSFSAGLNTVANGSLCSLGYNQQTIESSSITENIPDGSLEAQTKTFTAERDGSRELARIEAKLHNLRESTSDQILNLRTQSIQTLCESMRKQLVARAFYGWLAHCRRIKIVRTHLSQLLKQSHECCLVEGAERLASFRGGLTEARWKELMGNRADFPAGCLSRRVSQLVYYGGVEGDLLRQEVWPYLLECYSFDDTQEERQAKDERVRETYRSCEQEWTKVERIVRERDSELLAANIARASRGCAKEKVCTTNEVSDYSSTNDKNNNDQKSDGITEEEEEDEEDKSPDEEETDHDKKCREQENEVENKKSSTKSQRARNAETRSSAARRKRRARVRLESTGSVDSDASITDKFGNNIHRIDKDVQRCDRNFWYFKETRNLTKLRKIMCSYVWQNLDIGYVQGMCDLAAPFLVIFDDEIVAFSCFSQLMKRMVANFPHGCAMDQHFESLKYLMQVLDPRLFEILQSNGDYTHFYFCYRWLLLDFKRGKQIISYRND